MDQETNLTGFWTALAIIAICFFCARGAHAQLSPGYNSYSFQYLNGVLTSTNTITSRSINAFNAMNIPKYYSMSVTTAATGFTVLLEGSLDNANWTQLASTTSGIGVVTTVNPAPMLYIRMRAPNLSSTQQVTATAVGSW